MASIVAQMLGDKKRSQFRRLSDRLTHMSGGQFLLILSVTVWAAGGARAQETPPVRGNTATNTPAAGTNVTTTVTNTVPEVVGPELKPVEVAPEKPKDNDALAEARLEAKIKALKEFGVIVSKDPFRLNPPPKIEKPAEIEDFVPVGAPKLMGISTLYNPPKAVLRMSKAGGGKAVSVFLGPTEGKDGVEVVSVDVAASKVVVKVGEITYDLTIEKPKFASSPTPDRGSRFPPKGSSGTKRPAGSPSPRKPFKKPGGLKPIPARPDVSFRATPPSYALPAFNEVVQKLAVEPSQISTQREIIHGQLNYTVPTDFPEKLR